MYQVKALKKKTTIRRLGRTKDKNDSKWPIKQGKVHVQLSLGLNIHTPREVVTFIPNFTTHGRWTNCQKGLDQLSQVTISPLLPGAEQKICGLNFTETKKMWVKKFKSPTVTGTKRGWT
jgi:hypothetical protein